MSGSSFSTLTYGSSPLFSTLTYGSSPESPSFVSPSPEEVYEIFKRVPSDEDFCFQRTLEYECGEHYQEVLAWIHCLVNDVPCECPMPWGRDKPIMRFIVDNVVGRGRAKKLIPRLVSNDEAQVVAVVNVYEVDGKEERITLFKSLEDVFSF